MTELTIREWDRICPRPNERVLQTLLWNKVTYPTISHWKSRFKPLCNEYRVQGYILGAGTVLYMAGSLWYRRIKQLCFNAHSLECKAHCIQFSHVKSCCIQLYIAFKRSFKLKCIEYREHGYILAAGKVLYMAGSLWYRRINYLYFNEHSNIVCYERPLGLGPASFHFL